MMIENLISEEIAASVAAKLLSDDDQARLDKYWARAGLTDPARYLAAVVIMSGQQSPSVTTAVSTAEVIYATSTWRALLHLAAALDAFARTEREPGAVPINALVAESVRGVHAAITARVQIPVFPEQQSNYRSQ
jgi:hypothetical protein